MKKIDDDAGRALAGSFGTGADQAHIGWLLPSIGVQSALARLADTDMQAQLAYHDRIRAFHARLRSFHSGYLFTDKFFGKSDFDKAPKFEGR
jgi:ABC-2 type transport system permease protein